MHVEDAAAFIVDCIARPRPSDYPSYGYEVYLPNLIAFYQKEIEHQTDHESLLRNGPRAQELSPLFYEAAWELCRRGILRPGVQRLGGQSDGGGGDGYSVTALGKTWISQEAPAPVLIDPARLSELFAVLSKRLGSGFLQRATEAARCHAFGCYLASCAMCGAAAESILLAIATAKSGEEDAVLKLYRAPSGRHKVIEQIAKGLPPSIAGPFRSATGLLSFWRDEAAHGTASEISEIEAHEAVARLIRFSQFTNDRWTELTSDRAAKHA
jgi:hypothetical protein